MAKSFIAKIREHLIGPEQPAYMQQRGDAPLLTRLWRSIRPPAAIPKAPKPMSRMQRNLLRYSIAFLLLLGLSWAGWNYLSSSQERSLQRLQAGVRLLGPGNYKQAVAEFTAAIEINSGNAQAYLERGNVHNILAEKEAALADWNQAVTLDPKLAAAYTARGMHFRVGGDLERSLQELNRSIEIAPSMDAYFQRGQVHASRSDFQKAIEDYDRAIAEQRSAPYVYRARGVARKALGDESGYAADRDTADRLENNQ
jgi:tetratricopeptide (TPR) repeat protein